MSSSPKYIHYVKPSLDFFGAVCLLILLAPLFLLIALLIAATGRRVIFAQWRPGLRGKPFRLLKFRTMDETGAAVYGLGTLLRRSSLDELPQLVNILRGEMSFIGPRPLLMEYMESYTPEQLERHLVKPGVTGWAQVHGRNALRLSEKIEFDLYYVRNASFLLDMTILFRTFFQLTKWAEADYHTKGSQTSTALE